MFLVLNDRKKIMAISKSTTILDYGSVKLSNGLIICDEGLTVVEVASVPVGIKEEKYFYIDGEYVLNPNWEESQLSEKVNTLEKDNESLNEAIVDLTEFVVSTII